MQDAAGMWYEMLPLLPALLKCTFSNGLTLACVQSCETLQVSGGALLDSGSAP